MGKSGSNSARRVQAVAPARNTDNARLRASRPNKLSTRENDPEATRGQQNARATVMRVTPSSMTSSEGPAEAGCDTSIPGYKLHLGANPHGWNRFLFGD